MAVKHTKQPGIGGLLQRLLAWVIFLGLLSALNGCGFHPRGSSALPPGMAVTYINSAQPYGSLVDDFSAGLKSQGGHVTSLRSEATAILKITSNVLEKRVLSVDTAGKVLEYEVRQIIRFSVVTNENLSIVDEQEISLARDYIFSSTEVLSTEREDKTVRKVLQRNVVNLAMLRITAAAR